MANPEVKDETGFAKPPKHTQFVKGQSGNPKGRPRGSQNLETILTKAARERVKVTINGQTRYISKIEACVIQLFNKAASGDPQATREVLYWSRVCAESQKDGLLSVVPDDADNAVMESLLRRIRQSEIAASDAEIDSKSAIASRVKE